MHFRSSISSASKESRIGFCLSCSFYFMNNWTVRDDFLTKLQYLLSEVWNVMGVVLSDIAIKHPKVLLAMTYRSSTCDDLSQWKQLQKRTGVLSENCSSFPHDGNILSTNHLCCCIHSILIGSVFPAEVCVFFGVTWSCEFSCLRNNSKPF